MWGERTESLVGMWWGRDSCVINLDQAGLDTGAQCSSTSAALDFIDESLSKACLKL